MVLNVDFDHFSRLMALLARRAADPVPGDPRPPLMDILPEAQISFAEPDRFLVRRVRCHADRADHPRPGGPRASRWQRLLRDPDHRHVDVPNRWRDAREAWCAPRSSRPPMASVPVARACSPIRRTARRALTACARSKRPCMPRVLRSACMWNTSQSWRSTVAPSLGVEALLRWEDPTLGRVSPGEFIPVRKHPPDPHHRRLGAGPKQSAETAALRALVPGATLAVNASTAQLSATGRDQFLGRLGCCAGNRCDSTRPADHRSD